jgi:hypothetical protein
MQNTALDIWLVRTTRPFTNPSFTSQHPNIDIITSLAQSQS